MEADGLITRHKGTGRSKVEVELTEKGLDVFKQSLCNETDKRIFSVLSKRERERLELLLWKLRNGSWRTSASRSGISIFRSIPRALKKRSMFELYEVGPRLQKGEKL